MASGPLVILSEPNLNLMQDLSQSGFNALLICLNEGSHFFPKGGDIHLAGKEQKRKLQLV